MIVTFTDVLRTYGSEKIFEKLSLVINKGDKIALIGPNGSGKTTLLNMIAGELSCDSGRIWRHNKLTIGYLKQDSSLKKGSTIKLEMEDALSHIYDIQAKLAELSEQISTVSDYESDEYKTLMAEYQIYDERWIAADGYNAKTRIDTVLNVMGFGSFDSDTNVDTLSGGERTRLSLCKLLVESPDLLILDEATNHLDFRMLMWLEEFLNGYKGTVVMVSHDRYFLDKVANKTMEIELLAIVTYAHGYSKYLVMKEERRLLMQKNYEEREAKVAKYKEYHDKNIVRASTAASARSRLRMIEHLDDAPPPVPPPKPPHFRFTTKIKPALELLKVENITLSVGEGDSEKQLLSKFNLEVRRGEKVAIIGENGVGKTSLLSALVGDLKIRAGRVTWGKNAKHSFFRQTDEGLNRRKTALDELWDRYPKRYELEIRTTLGNVGLTAEEVYKYVGVLSGGERARVKLAILMYEQANVLILDEPTNHLDIESKEALDKALLEFDGTIILVSHDRYLLSKLPTRIVELTKHGVINFKGGFDEYVNSEQFKAEPAVDNTPQDAEKKSGKQKQSAKKRASKRNVTTVEEEIHNNDVMISYYQKMLTSPDYSSDYEKLSEFTTELETLQNKQTELWSEWEELQEDEVSDV